MLFGNICNICEGEDSEIASLKPGGVSNPTKLFSNWDRQEVTTGPQTSANKTKYYRK